MSQTVVRFQVQVQDEHGIPIEGPDILFSVNGEPAGGVFGSNGTASFEAPYGVSVAASVEFLEIKKTLDLTDSSTRYTFEFPRPTEILPAARQARCPDGTTGQPCVDCKVDGKNVRICG